MAKPTDRRQWVTPEDLNLSPEVLGLPLASPTRRLVAMGLDLVVIGLLSSLANFWWLSAIALVGIEHARGQQRGRSPRRQRWAWGAAALLVMTGAVQLWQDSGRPKQVTRESVADALAEAEAYRAEALDDAKEAVGDNAEATAPKVSADPASAASAPNAASAPASAGAASPTPAAASQTPVPDAVMSRALLQQAKRIRTLEGRLKEARAMRSLDPRAWLKHWADELGLGYGFALVYFSLLPAWWGGQTVGKRLLGLRVMELTGKRMGALLCLKRFGGYAAGMATGGLGLAQLLWDPNRQAIQDKTAHTVVIDLRRPRLSALAGPAALDQPAAVDPPVVEPPAPLISSRSASSSPP